jgi:hypothetical protein
VSYCTHHGDVDEKRSGNLKNQMIIAGWLTGKLSADMFGDIFSSRNENCDELLPAEPVSG